MHLRGTATQQVNKGWIEGHDGISQMHTILLVLFLTSKPANQENIFSLTFVPGIALKQYTKGLIIYWVKQWSLMCKCHHTYCTITYIKRLSFLTVGPSLAGSSEILMASSIAASRPFPPSPLRAGPKHSGRRMSRRTTTLAFSSTLSPARSRCENVSESFSQLKTTSVIIIWEGWPLTKTAKRRKSRYLSPPQGFQPMSG